MLINLWHRRHVKNNKVILYRQYLKINTSVIDQEWQRSVTKSCKTRTHSFFFQILVPKLTWRALYNNLIPYSLSVMNNCWILGEQPTINPRYSAKVIFFHYSRLEPLAYRNSPQYYLELINLPRRTVLVTAAVTLVTLNQYSMTSLTRQRSIQAGPWRAHPCPLRGISTYQQAMG